nr:prostate and testis expressed protein 4 [Peromyscus maniculatus bairdii]
MNPATKISTLLIVTLSLLCSVESLICNVCKHSRNSKCTEGQERCVATRGHSCATISHYSDGKESLLKKIIFCSRSKITCQAI